MRIHRLGFAALQGHDDVLDGDHPIEIEPLDLASDIRTAIEVRKFDDSEWGVLFGSLQELLDAISPSGEGCHELVALIDAMMFDCKRVKEHSILSRDGLFTQLRCTFSHAISLSLIATGSRLRARDVPELVEMLSWCSLVRDLPEDWRKGLINVPAEVLNYVGWNEIGRAHV